METEFPGGGVMLRATDVGLGPVVVLLHAGGERRQVWDPVARVLAGEGYRAVAVDLRGHGESGGSMTDGLLAFAGDVRALVARLDAPVLVGASLGGLAAMSALADSGTRESVAGLVLLDVIPDPDPETVWTYLGIGSPGAPEASLVADGLSRAAELRAAAGTVTAPTTLLRGARSPVVTEADTRRFRALIPHAAVRTVPEAGHLLARDAPAAVTAALLDHLTGHNPK